MSERKPYLPLALGLACAILTVAGCVPPPVPLGFPGPLEAAEVDLYTSDTEPEITVYYPVSETPLKDLPVIVYSTGWNQPRISYASYGKQYAQWGYVAAVRSYPTLGFDDIGDLMNEEHLAHMSSILDTLAEENERPGSPLFGMVDAANAAAAGHSQGAFHSLAAPLHDSRFKAVVSMDTSPTGGELEELSAMLPDSTADIMFIRAEWEKVFWAHLLGDKPRLIDYVETPSLEVTITDATHLDFMDFMVGIFKLGEAFFPRRDADPEVVRAVTTRYCVSWFNVHLKGMQEFETYYNGEESEQDIADGLVKIFYQMD